MKLEAFRITTKVFNGSIAALKDIPFPDGQEVDVTIAPKQITESRTPTYPLRGLPFEYENPFEPACPPEDWGALSF